MSHETATSGRHRMAIEYNGYLNVLFVCDLTRARDFYQNTVGLEFVHSSGRTSTPTSRSGRAGCC